MRDCISGVDCLAEAHFSECPLMPSRMPIDKVYVVTADYGLNGADCLGVFQSAPTSEEVEELASAHFEGLNFGPSNSTGYGGCEVHEMTVIA